jgi:hypothetical protein
MTGMTIARSSVACLLCLVGAVCMRAWSGSSEPWQLWIPTALLGLGAVLAFHRSSGSQILVRAILWSNLLLATMVAWISSGHDQRVAAVLGASTGLALLVLGRHGLDDDRGAFVPVAFRATLLALLVMALSDAQSLLFWGTVLVSDESPARVTGAFSLACAVAFTVGVAGLYRLRTWGLLVDTLAAISLIGVVLLGAFSELRAFQILFGGSALLQLALAVPLYRALVRGARQAPTISRSGVWIGSVAVQLLVLAAVAPAVYRFISG